MTNTTKALEAAALAFEMSLAANQKGKLQDATTTYIETLMAGSEYGETIQALRHFTLSADEAKPMSPEEQMVAEMICELADKAATAIETLVAQVEELKTVDDDEFIEVQQRAEAAEAENSANIKRAASAVGVANRAEAERDALREWKEVALGFIDRETMKDIGKTIIQGGKGDG